MPRATACGLAYKAALPDEVPAIPQTASMMRHGGRGTRLGLQDLQDLQEATGPLVSKQKESKALSQKCLGWRCAAQRGSFF